MLNSAKRQRENKKSTQVGKVQLEVGEARNFIDRLVFCTFPLRGFVEHHRYSHTAQHAGTTAQGNASWDKEKHTND